MVFVISGVCLCVGYSGVYVCVCWGVAQQSVLRPTVAQRDTRLCSQDARLPWLSPGMQRHTMVEQL